MESREINRLVKQIRKLKEEGLVPPNVPYPVWLELAKILPLPTVEVLITHNGEDFLLTERHDEYWNGWHIPGGFIIVKETLTQACSRLAQKELAIGVHFQYISDVYVWENHPYGGPISIVCICEAEGEPKVGKFFTKIPQKTIESHKTFIENFLLGKKIGSKGRSHRGK